MEPKKGNELFSGRTLPVSGRQGEEVFLASPPAQHLQVKYEHTKKKQQNPYHMQETFEGAIHRLRPVIVKCRGFQNVGESCERALGSEAVTIFSCDHCHQGEHCFFCESALESVFETPHLARN